MATRVTARKKPGPPKGEGGRPPRQIDYTLVDRLAGFGCSIEEISVAIGFDRSYVHERIRRGDDKLREAIDKGRETGRQTLRRLQWHKAEQGDTTMCIWLGKQLLGQRDKHALTGEDGGAVVSEVTYTWQKPDE